jgi:hypothetical protein
MKSKLRLTIDVTYSCFPEHVGVLMEQLNRIPPNLCSEAYTGREASGVSIVDLSYEVSDRKNPSRLDLSKPLHAEAFNEAASHYLHNWDDTLSMEELSELMAYEDKDQDSYEVAAAYESMPVSVILDSINKLAISFINFKHS